MAAETKNDTTTVRISRELHDSLSETVPKKMTYGEYIERALEPKLED